MANILSQLIVSLVDQVTGPAKQVGASIEGMNRRISEATSSPISMTDKLAAASTRAQRRMNGYRTQMVDAVATMYTLGRAIGSPVQASRQFEAAFADVKKVVEFPTEGPYSAEAFRQSLIDLSRRVPLTVEELTQIAAAGGQAGVAIEELAGFTENVAQVSTAFEISTADAGKSLANLKAALKLSNPQVMLLADHMNVLANNMATSESQVLDVVNRVGALGAVVGIETKHVAALGAAMTSAGGDAESAGTALRNMFLNLSQGEGMTDDAVATLEKIGLNAESLPSRMQTEGIEAIVDLLERVAALPKEEQAASLTNLFDKRAVDAIGPMLNNLDLLRQSLGLVQSDTENLGASQREFEKRNDTFDAGVKTLQNTMNGLAIAIGDALIPALTSVMEKITPIIDTVTRWASENPKLTASILGIVGGLVAFNGAMIAVKYFGTYGYVAFLNLAKGVTVAATSFTTLSGAIAATGIGAILIGIAMAGIWIYNNWSGIAAMFDEFGKAFSNALGPEASAVLGGIIDGISTLWNWVNNLLGPINQSEEGWRGWGAAAGEALAGVVNWFTSLDEKVAALPVKIGEMFRGVGDSIRVSMENGLNTVISSVSSWTEQFATAGHDLAQAMIDAIKNAFNDLLAWFSGLPGKIVSAIGNIDVSGLIKWPSLPSWLGGGDAEPAAEQPPARARGGPISRGSTYMVGERGPELITAGRSGYVNKAGSFPAGGITINQSMVFNVDGSASEDVVEKIRRVMKDEVRETFRGVFSDTGLRFA
jgi:TP901 family phage tail tape measure protein